jgi:hypothetical protein
MSGLDNGPAVLFFFLKFSVKMYFFFLLSFLFSPNDGKWPTSFFSLPNVVGNFIYFLERKRKTDVYENGRQSSRRKNNNSEIPVFLLFRLPVC